MQRGTAVSNSDNNARTDWSKDEGFFLEENKLRAVLNKYIKNWVKVQFEQIITGAA